MVSVSANGACAFYCECLLMGASATTRTSRRAGPVLPHPLLGHPSAVLSDFLYRMDTGIRARAISGLQVFFQDFSWIMARDSDIPE